ncbi:MAG: NAD(P)/FAD-dependent oxidoreductase [Bryobacteraceae bacterium]|nr:NAD(P)/FAD-dependent oxidoreductase [Bryobacteraceae bacterium]
MLRSFDLAVIGTGSAAKSVASPCRAAGWTVAMVDDRAFGGTCANRGCDPKKVLVGVSSVFDAARRMQGNGLSTQNLRMSWPEAMRFKGGFTDGVPASTEKSLADEGIESFHGTARFVSAEALEVDGERIEARHFAICAGATPVRLGIPGEELLITSDDFLELSEIPESVVFVGGGYIAFEFAHLAARAGASVTILHRGKSPLGKFDPWLVEMLLADSRRIGIDVRLASAVERVEGTLGDFTVHIAGGAKVGAGLVVHAAGRVPNLEALDLGAAGIEATGAGVKVNEFLASVSHPRAYAAGDAADSGGPQLTPVAGLEGRIVAQNLLQGNHERADYKGCASVVFTTPPLASVGLTEEAAQRDKLEFDVRSGDSSGWYSSRRLAEHASGYKVLIERGSERILGAHLFGESADEHINVFALAIRAGLAAPVLRQTLFAYPTHGSNTQYML